LIESTAVAIRFGNVDGRYWSAMTNKVENRLRVFGIRFEKSIKTTRAQSVLVHPESQDGPGFHRNDTCFMGPLLGELARSIKDVVKKRQLVRAEAREERLVMRRNKHIDKVELNEPEPASYTPEIAGCNRSVRPGGSKALGGKRDTARRR
jgi:hypothetical protein